MIKIKKGDKIKHPFITGDDIINTKESEEKGTVVTIDDVLDKHKKEIDKLKSNVKYIYSYGGVGGNGHGGSGGGSTGTPMLFVSLGGHQVQNGTENIIVFSKPDKYTFEGSLSNANGEIYYVYVGYGKNIKNPKQFVLDKDNRWIIKPEIYDLKENGEIVVTLKDVEGRTLSTVRQTYVVEAHTFEAKFKYVFEDREIEFSPYEYFMGNYNQRTPFIDISFSINIPNVQNVIVKYNIKGVDGKSDVQYSDSMEDITTGSGSVSYGQITNSNLRIYLENLERNNIPFIDENNTGTYDVTITLDYSVSGSPADTSVISFKITLIPNDLYINVRNSHNILYDNLDELRDELSRVPEDQEFNNAIPVGTNTSFYCKVYEQAITSNKKIYDIIFNAYDEDITSEDGFDVNPHYTKTKVAEEQVETPQPINVAFDSPGIKKLKFVTTGKKNPSDICTIIKYIYVKVNKNQIDWYPTIEQQDSYFRANQGTDTYKDFPELPITNNSPLEMSETNAPLTLTHSSWKNVQNGYDTTILSFGIQYGAVNSDHSEVIKIYKDNSVVVNLRSDTLFSESDKKILLPPEKNLNPSDSSKYHLVQIVRYKIGVDTSSGSGGYLYGTYLYIDGKLESDDPTTPQYNPLYIDKIILNNVNVIYNLISVQYIKMKQPSEVVSDKINNNTIDGIIYQHYLAYKNRMNVGEVSESERVLLTNIPNMKFDGTNVIVNYTFLEDISKFMPIPTMMMSFGSQDDGDPISENELITFRNNLFKGYQSGNDEAFGDPEISLYWCDGIKNGIQSSNISKIIVPTLNDEGTRYDGTWHVKLQGTSTMRNRIKNFSLYIEKRDSDLPKTILMSPNYDSTNPHSFLPENEWTLKADIADSAHANNTAVGKFVNYACTPFSNGLSLSDEIKPFIKNTLEGFPVLMYFRIGEEVYYLGVYNFNMGRKSYYNLGYHSVQDTTNMINYIPEHSSSSFTFSLGSGTPIENLVIAEIQENWADFDFHQWGDDVLFQDNGDPRTMFGIPKDKMTYTNIDNAKSTLREFVKSVGKAGAYCFANIGKIPVSSEGDGGSCENRYKAEEEDGVIKEYVPDLSYQFYYNQDNKRVYLPQDNANKFENIKVDIDNLLKCIHTLDKEGAQNKNRLNFTSVSEYYTICMAFGLIDSILKNMNIKCWDGTTCYTAFYDMDCAFGEDNIGRENVSYLAATDYWYSPTDSGYVEPIKKMFDYWNKDVGKGFDFTSSYLFAIAKYAQAILNVEKNDLVLHNYPQQFWVNLRNGELKNADYFMKNYFSSGIGSIPAYLASLNYQVKYLYYGSVIDDDGRETESRYFANESAFNGTRFEKVREWLDKRLHFLDFMFNVQGVDIPIGSTIYKIPVVPERNGRDDLKANNDVVILKDAFSTNTAYGAIIGSDGDYIGIEAPLNTPMVINRGKGYNMYLLTAGVGSLNNIKITVTESETHRVFGSTEFINMTSVEPVLTNAYKIESDNLKEIKYGGRAFQESTINLNIRSSSVKKIELPIPTLKGNLTIDSDTSLGQALHTLDIHNSGFYGTWSNLKNLENLNISSVNGGSDSRIQITGCPLVGENCNISGTVEKPTTLSELILSNVKGKFKLENTKIKTIDISANQGEDAEFEIIGDIELTKLTLTRFKSVIIRGCPKLETLMILDPDEGNKVCETIIIDIPEYRYANGTEPTGLINFNSENDVLGRFDFTGYDKLKTLGLSGCKNVVVIKMPNHPVEIETFSNNRNLEFVDTTGERSCIIITRDSTFYKCPYYAMKQSWAMDDNLYNDSPIWNIKENLSNSIPRTRSGNRPYICNKRTKMCIKPLVNDIGCTSLANTFFKQSRDENSPHATTGNPYTNEWNQKVYNPGMSMNDAVWFINSVVEGKPIDDAYIMDDGTIVDKQSEYETTFGEDCSENITSLQGCFAQQGGITYKGSLSSTVPNLSHYKNLNNISSMYLNTGVTFISSDLLHLYDGNNDNASGHALSWNDFVKTENIYVNAFEYISYRISSLNSSYTIYDPTIGNGTPLVTSESNRFNVVNMLCPQMNNESHPIPFNRITSISNFSINPDQWVDYSELLIYCPNVTSINGFLNGMDLSRAKVDRMLKTCTQLTGITDSFNHSSAEVRVENMPYSIDLYDFFNWADVDSVKNNLFNIQQLFSTENNTDKTGPGFAIRKHISWSNFKKIIGTLHKYTALQGKLSNIFSYCTIGGIGDTGYSSNYEIALADDMKHITSINNLFYKCKSPNGPLRIRRSFFAHLPNVTKLVNTFNSVEFDHMLSYDFFCKRKEKTENVYVEVNGKIPSHSNAILHTYEYTKNQSDLYGCFANAKFRNCKAWFDLKDGNELLKQEKDNVTKSDGTPFDFTVNSYYRFEGGNHVEYKISEPTAYSDTLNNFTNYVSSIRILGEGSNVEDSIVINNHRIFDSEYSDFSNYGTYSYGKPYIKNAFNIYPAYCCLPPDILYACDYNCDLEYVFADTNIIGTLPQHLLGIYNYRKLNDMFRNVNILPNLIYHCDDRLTVEEKQDYIKILNGNLGEYSYLISSGGIPIDEDTINPDGETPYSFIGSESDKSDKTVLFRNSNGELRRRRHTGSNSGSNGDYNKSQFAYVPQGFTTNVFLQNAFTFRYNLPSQINLSESGLALEGINWPAGSYSESYNPDANPQYWPYYTQYFFMTDESVSWKDVSTMGSPFISDEKDVDFSTGDTRVLSTLDSSYKNSWWGSIADVNKGYWDLHTNGLLNVFLNVCGMRNTRTGIFKDCGALINRSIDARNVPNLERFVSGTLVVFLNGKVFNEGVDGIRLTKQNGSNIISYDKGFSRNIILPKLGNPQYTVESQIPKVLLSLPSSSESILFYEFMFPSDGISLPNYRRYYLGDYIQVHNPSKYIVSQ